MSDLECFGEKLSADARDIGLTWQDAPTEELEQTVDLALEESAPQEVALPREVNKGRVARLLEWLRG